MLFLLKPRKGGPLLAAKRVLAFYQTTLRPPCPCPCAWLRLRAAASERGLLAPALVQLEPLRVRARVARGARARLQRAQVEEPFVGRRLRQRLRTSGRRGAGRHRRGQAHRVVVVAPARAARGALGRARPGSPYSMLGCVAV